MSCVLETASRRAIRSKRVDSFIHTLRKLLNEHCQIAVVVDTAGVSGETVVPSMTNRLEKLLNKSSNAYDWVIILGGTNDLGMGTKGDDLLPHLLGLHETAKKTGAKTLALALPQYLHELKPGNEKYRAEKAKVNDGLRVYSEKSAGSILSMLTCGMVCHLVSFLQRRGRCSGQMASI